MTVTDDHIAEDYRTLLDQGYVARELAPQHHDTWRKGIRRRCRHDKLKVQTGPVYNGDLPPIAVEAYLPARWSGTHLMGADAEGNILIRHLDAGEDPLEESIRFAAELDELRERQGET